MPLHLDNNDIAIIKSLLKDEENHLGRYQEKQE